MIAIIGAGPVGCYAASLLADNFEVAVFEEHPTIGLPVQCTGILTSEIFSFIPRRNDFIVNKASKVRIFAPNNKFLRLELEKPDSIVDRQRLDNYFYNLAKKKGAKFYISHKFLGIKDSQALVKDLKSGRAKKFGFDYIIGADGPLSAVAKAAGLYGNRKLFVGLQAVVRKRNNNIIDFYPLQNGFGWAVPENKSALRVGLACTKNTREEFQKIIRKYKGKVLAKQGGLIPLFNPSASFCKENIFLIGDAAGFVKATTGGGIIPGLKSAEIAANAIKNRTSYAGGVYLQLFPSLILNLEMRKLMDSLTSEEWNDLVKELSSSESKEVLQKINRDQLFSLLLNLSLKKPSLLAYGLKHFPDLF